MAIIRIIWAELAGGKETLWYEYDDVLGVLTNVGQNDASSTNLLVKENDEKYVEHKLSSDNKESSITSIKRPLIQIKDIVNGKKITGVDIITT